jgi:hypothetical protein
MKSLVSGSNSEGGRRVNPFDKQRKVLAQAEPDTELNSKKLEYSSKVYSPVKISRQSQLIYTPDSAITALVRHRLR